MPSPSGDLTERVVIQNVSVIQGGLLVTAKAKAGEDVTIAIAWIKYTNGTIATRGDMPSTVLPMDGTLKDITVILPPGSLSSGTNYMVTLVSLEGESFVSPTFTFVTT